MNGLVIDLFAGGGGASTGIEAALGRPVDIAINHSPIAIAVHKANHGGTLHYTTDVFDVDPIEATKGRPVDLVWASPDCTHFSKAKGSRPDRPRSKKIRSLAWVVVRWAKAVRPRVICLENVEEFLTWGPLHEGQPVREKQGNTFRAWAASLRRLGYVIDWKILDASRYGAPTRRKRLFVVARCDGEPIAWPAPTHGPGLLPYRTAGECIDWSIATRSIFGRKRPLAEKTMQRIAEGIRRFVLENPRPYIVRVNHGRDDWRGQETSEPLTTVEASRRGHAVVAPVLTAYHNGPGGERRNTTPEEPLRTVDTSNRYGVVAPVLVEPGQRHGRGQKSAEDPLSTVVAKDRHALATPVLVKFRHDSPGQSMDEPMPVVTSGGNAGGRPAGAAHALGIAAPVLVRTDMHKSNAGCVYPPEDPLRTVTSSGGHAVAEVALVDMQRDNAPRDLNEPLGVVTTQGNRFNLLRAAFVAKHFGGVYGQKPDDPIGTITARDHHGPVAAALLKFRGDPASHPSGGSLDEPMPTITAQGMHLAECRAFLTKWYSAPQEKGASLFDPAPTATGKARFGLVVVDGVEYEIGDIFLRMLEPEELLRAQFGEFAEGYDLSSATTKEAKTRLVGNSVCPHVARALVAANVPTREAAVA